MKRKRTLVLFLTIPAALIVLAAIAVAILVEPDAIRERALTRAREATGYQIEAGPASVKIGFSGAGIRVDALQLADPESTQVLQVDRVDVYVKLLPLLRRQVELGKVVLHRPRYRLAGTDGDGEVASRTGEAPALAFLAVESWSVQDGAYLQTGDWGEFSLTGLDLDGGFLWKAGRGGEGEASGDLGGGTLRRGESRWDLPATAADIRFRVNANADSLHLTRIEISGQPLRADLEGAYGRGPEGWSGAVHGSLDAVEWEALEPLLPDDLRASLAGIEIQGTLAVPELRLAREGMPPAATTSGRLVFSGFGVKAPGAPLGLSEAGGEVRFSPEGIVLDSGTGRLGEEAVRWSGSVEGSAPARLKLGVSTRLPGETLGKLLPAGSALTLGGGTAALDLDLESPWPLQLPPSIRGTVILDRLEGTYRELPLWDAGGTLRFAGRSAAVEELQASLGSSRFRLNGTMDEIADPDFRFRLVSEVMDLDELFPPRDPKTSGETETEAGLVALPGSGRVEVGALRFRGARLVDTRARVGLSLSGLAVKELEARAYGGTVGGGFTLTPISATEWAYDGELRFRDVGAGPLLADWTRWGRHVEGTMSGELKLEGRRETGGDPLRALSIDGGILADRGAFLSVPGLETVARTLRIKEASAERWPFRGLSLGFSVRNGNVMLEKLSMNQTGFSWNVTGRIGLDGSLALEGTVLADPATVDLSPQLQVLAPYLAAPDGRIPLDFKVGGTLSGPAPSIDWDGLTRRAAEKARTEEAGKLEQKLETVIEDPQTLDKLKRLLRRPGGG